MMQAHMIPGMIGLLKRIEDSIVKAGVAFCSYFRREYLQ